MHRSELVAVLGGERVVRRPIGSPMTPAEVAALERATDAIDMRGVPSAVDWTLGVPFVEQPNGARERPRDEQQSSVPHSAFTRSDYAYQGRVPIAQTYRPLAGAAENSRGGSVIIAPTDATTRTRTILETPEYAGEDAEALLVTLGAPLASTGPVELVCVLDWGVGSAPFHAELDWVVGTVISMPASYAKVGVRPARVVTAQVTVAASLSYGPGRNASNARRTVTVGDLAPSASSAVFRVPDWARSFTVVCASANAPNLRAIVSDDASPTWTTFSDFTSRANNAAQNAGAVDLVNGARYMQITNLSGTDPMANVRAVFQLGL